MFPADRTTEEEPATRPPLPPVPSAAAVRVLSPGTSLLPRRFAVSPDCHDPGAEMAASFPGSCKAVGPAEDENGDLDGSLQQMLKAIADERNRLNVRQEISGLGERIRVFVVSPGSLLGFSHLVKNQQPVFNQKYCCYYTEAQSEHHILNVSEDPLHMCPSVESVLMSPDTNWSSRG